jgi:hypothetical protein
LTEPAKADIYWHVKWWIQLSDGRDIVPNVTSAYGAQFTWFPEYDAPDVDIRLIQGHGADVVGWFCYTGYDTSHWCTNPKLRKLGVDAHIESYRIHVWADAAGQYRFEYLGK